MVAVVAAACGLLLALPSSSANATVTNRGPFYLALFNLSMQPILSYSGSDPGKDTSWNIAVASGGQEIGTLIIAGQRVSVMEVAGRTYFKPPASLLNTMSGSAPVSKIRGRWITGNDDFDALMPTGLEAPGQLADGYLADLADNSDFPAMDAPPVKYHGTPALAATLTANTLGTGKSSKTGRTPSGRLYVSASEPYRVLGTQTGAGFAATSSNSGSTPAQAARPDAFVTRTDSAESAGSAAATAEPSFTPMTPAQVNQEYGQLIDQTKSLNSAVDVGISVSFNQTGNLICSNTNCTVDEVVSTSTTSTQDAQLSGSVSADMTAAVTVNGQPAGGCAQTTGLPINGTGTMTCDDAGVAPAVEGIKAQAQAQADDEAAADPGHEVSVPYSLSFKASVQIIALAQVQAAVSREVDGEQSQQSDAATEEQEPQRCVTAYTDATGTESNVLDAATHGTVPARYDGKRPNCFKLFNSGRFEDHVLERHVKGGSEVTKQKSLFQNYWTPAMIKALIQVTVRFGKASPNTPNPVTHQPRTGTVYEMHFPFKIGYKNKNGAPLNGLRVLVYPNGTLNTAHPIK